MGQAAPSVGNLDKNQKDFATVDPNSSGGDSPWTRLLAGGIKGLATGLQNTNFQPRAPNVPMSPFESGARSVDPAYFQPQVNRDRRMGGMAGNNLAFYGGPSY